jgi:hypothetical protein
MPASTVLTRADCHQTAIQARLREAVPLQSFQQTPCWSVRCVCRTLWPRVSHAANTNTNCTSRQRKIGVNFPDTCGNRRVCLRKQNPRVRWLCRLKYFFILHVMAFPFLFFFYNTFLNHDLGGGNSLTLLLSVPQSSTEYPWILAPQSSHFLLIFLYYFLVFFT